MAAPAHKVVLLRHGESEWNVANKFTGWTDVDLTSKGTAEANAAGQLLKAEVRDAFARAAQTRTGWYGGCETRWCRIGMRGALCGKRIASARVGLDWEMEGGGCRVGEKQASAAQWARRVVHADTL